MKLAWALLACMVVCATASDYSSGDKSGVANRTSYSYYINGCLLIYVRNGRFKTSDGRKVFYVPLGTSVKFHCNSGYTLDAPYHGECIKSSYSYYRGVMKYNREARPVCVPDTTVETCKKPSNLPWTIYTRPYRKTTFYVGDSITYYCRSGYQLQGTASVSCLKGGIWAAKTPICVREPKCKKPTGLHEAISTAPKDKTIFKVDEKIWYTCKTGYTLKGYADIKCVAANKWQFEPPTCVPNTCEKPTGLHEAIFTAPKDKTTFAVDEKIWYKCQTGYKLKGYADIKCVGPNKWQFEPPTCVPNSCQKPTGLHEAIFTLPKNKTIFAVDEKIWYKCKTGYKLKGYADIKCIAPNKWKFDPPTCVPNTCEKPTGLHEAIFTVPKDKTTFAVDEKIWYKCQTGYKLKGYADIKCVGPNNWQFEPPTCVPNSCQKPTGLHEAIFTAPKGKTVFAVYENIWYKCETGYKLKGNADIKCIAPNKWASEPPTCVPKFCRKPTGLHEAIFTAPKGKEVFEIYEKIWYKCKTGYILKGYADIKCIGPDQWKFDPPTCVPNFCTKPTDLHEAIFTLPKDKETFAIGEKIWYKCQTGYTLKGYADIPCLSPNQWKLDPPTCVPDVVRSCSTPAIPEYGFIKPVQKDYFKGQQVNFFCNLGFEIRGEDQLTCLENGKWSDVEPKCVKSQPKKCKPPVINHGVSHRPHQDSYDPEIVVWFGCELGYIIKGSKDRTCQNNGTWTGEDSYCVLPIVKARSSSAAYDDCDDVYDYNC